MSLHTSRVPPGLSDWAKGAATRLERWSQKIPLGGELARMSAMTGMVESFVVSRGSLLQAGQGALLSWASAAGGEFLSDWSDRSLMKKGKLSWLQPVVAQIGKAGEVVPGAKANMTLTGVFGAFLGAIQGLLTKNADRSRWKNVWVNALQGGVQRLIASWASDQILEVANYTQARVRPKVVPAIQLWKRGGPPVDMTINGEQLPSDLIRQEHKALNRRLTGTQGEKRDWLVNRVTEGRRKLYARVGLAFSEPSHHVYLTTLVSDYVTDDHLRDVKYLFDLKGESFIRLQNRALKRPLRTLGLDLATAFVRAEDSGHWVHSEPDDKGVEQLVVWSGYRKWTKREPSISTAEEIENRSFDAAAADVLSWIIMEEDPAHPPVDTRNNEGLVKAGRFSKLYAAYSTAEANELTQALLVGKKKMTLVPLRSFFHPAWEQLEPRELQRLDQDILTVNVPALLAWHPPAAQAAAQAAEAGV